MISMSTLASMAAWRFEDPSWSSPFRMITQAPPPIASGRNSLSAIARPDATSARTYESPAQSISQFGPTSCRNSGGMEESTCCCNVAIAVVSCSLSVAVAASGRVRAGRLAPVVNSSNARSSSTGVWKRRAGSFSSMRHTDHRRGSTRQH
jgi:hypothetical protein